jgi:hypothetical protein
MKKKTPSKADILRELREKKAARPKKKKAKQKK